MQINLSGSNVSYFAFLVNFCIYLFGSAGRTNQKLIICKIFPRMKVQDGKKLNDLQGQYLYGPGEIPGWNYSLVVFLHPECLSPSGKNRPPVFI
jgi:hypothetical protein